MILNLPRNERELSVYFTGLCLGLWCGLLAIILIMLGGNS